MIAWDTYTLRQQARKLPCVFDHISLERDKLIMVDTEFEPPYTIHIWDLSSGCFRKINTFSDLCLWHVDADENILVAFEIDWDKHPPEVRQTKWNFTGQLLDKRQFNLSLSDRDVDGKILELSKSVIDLPRYSCRTYGHKRVRNLSHCGTQRREIHLMYDYAIDKLSAQWFDKAPPAFDYFNLPPVAVLTSKILYYWCRDRRWLMLFNADNISVLTRPYQFDAREIRVRKLLWPSASSQDGATADERERALLIFGDREVFGAATEDGIQLWFFNPNFTPDLPGAEPFLPVQESA